MKTIKNKFYECPEANVLSLKSQGVFLTSFGLNNLTEDNTDAGNEYTQF